MSPEIFNEMQTETSGEFGGLGIEVGMEAGVVKVISPIDDTPASRAGIKAGDYIVKINNIQVQGKSLSESVDLMRGPVGSEITLTIVRIGEKDPFDVVIVRDVIRLTAAKVRSEGNVIIIRVTTFNEQTTPNIENGIKSQIDQLDGIDNVLGFIVDLRNNPGGLLSEAISVTDMFSSSINFEVPPVEIMLTFNSFSFFKRGSKPDLSETDIRADLILISKFASLSI